MSLVEFIEENMAKYNLVIRRIPDKVYSTYDFSYHKEGNEIINNGGRMFTRETKIPTLAGKYLCKQIDHNDSIVKFSINDDIIGNSIIDCIEKVIKLNERE